MERPQKRAKIGAGEDLASMGDYRADRPAASLVEQEHKMLLKTPTEEVRGKRRPRDSHSRGRRMKQRPKRK